MNKRNKIIYWIATVWLALGMVSTGAAQILQMKAGPGAVDSMNHLGYPAYFITIIGVWKILGVAVLFIPTFPVVKEWAYAGLFFVMSGAIISHIAVVDPVNEIFPALLLLTLVVVSWYFKSAVYTQNTVQAG